MDAGTRPGADGPSPLGPSPRPTLLRGVDRAAFAVSLTARLRAAGVAADLTATGDLIGALHVCTPEDRRELYWLARIALVRRHADLAVFDAVFAAVFADAVLPMDPHARRRPLQHPRRDDDVYRGLPREDAEPDAGSGLPWATLPSVTGPAEDAADAVTVPQLLPGALAGLPDEPFEELGHHELEMLGRALAAAAGSRPARRTGRMAADRSGRRIALRATMSRARRTGFEPVWLVTSSPRWRPRRVVMLCDVSQSMQAQTAAHLHLMRALALGWGAEVFAFATRLTRLTAALSHRSPEAAVAAATDAVGDRFGGTRIARNLEELLAGRHGGLLRGAIVLIGSDGWDTDPPERLGRAMARLHRRAHQVVWMNPRVAAPGFEPQVATMAAALPFCDEFLPADAFAGFSQVIAALAPQRWRPVTIRPAGPAGPADRAGRGGRQLNSTASRGSTAGSGRR